jgi:hypothetical protein
MLHCNHPAFIQSMRPPCDVLEFRKEKKKKYDCGDDNGETRVYRAHWHGGGGNAGARER